VALPLWGTRCAPVVRPWLEGEVMTADDVRVLVEKRLRSEIALPGRTIDWVLDILTPTFEVIAETAERDSWSSISTS